ncbi:hypothetical protein LINPERPRIM_LOCUS36181 [Linum perenne]
MEANDPHASMAALCSVFSSQESAFSDQNSGDDDLGPGEISSGTSATASETDLEEEGEEDDDFVFHTPPEASFSVSDSDVFHTPTRASSSLQSSQEAAQPEEIISGGAPLDDGTDESVGDSAEAVPIDVDLESEADLSFSGGDSPVDFPDGVDQTREIEVIHHESVKSRVLEVESDPNGGIRMSLMVKSVSPDSNRSELTKITRIIRLKESLHKLESLSGKRDNWKNNLTLETREPSLDNESKFMPERSTECEEKLFMCSGMNVIPDASIDCSEPGGTVQKNNEMVLRLQDHQTEDIDKVADDGRLHRRKRKLELFDIDSTDSDSEENNVVTEYNLDAFKHINQSNQACNNGDAEEDTVNNENQHTNPVKKPQARVRFTALHILKMLAQDSDHHDPRFETMSLVEIAKFRGMTFP